MQDDILSSLPGRFCLYHRAAAERWYRAAEAYSDLNVANRRKVVVLWSVYNLAIVTAVGFLFYRYVWRGRK